MTVSSGNSPMAYVLSQQRTETSCLGQHLIKFDPLIFSIIPIWIIFTVDGNCLGLTFGRDENLLYVSSAQNWQVAVSLIDSNGNSKWQYVIPGGFQYHSNRIQYKATDTFTDMILSTSSGSNLINYNRIISSSFSPYTVSTSQSQTFTDPTISTTSSIRQSMGIYIIDINNAVSLIWDQSFIYLAKINFQLQSISFQIAFPTIFQVPTAIFTSPSIYYAGFYENYFYTDQQGQVNSYSINPIQAVVYSSDSTTTSCYSMGPLAVSTPITMTISSITYLSTPIYSSGTGDFINDTQAYFAVDIIQQKLKRVSQCLICPFTIDTVTQNTSIFYAPYGLSDSYFPITPFQATVYSGTYTNTWSYSGFDNSDGHELISLTDHMSVNSSTGEIFVSQSKPIGTYRVKVMGTLPDQITTTYEIFTINIYLIKQRVVKPPKFARSIIKQIDLISNNPANYTLPIMEGVADEYIIHSPSLPSFVSFKFPFYQFFPDKPTHLGISIISGKLFNSQGSLIFLFTLNVTNQAPYFSDKIPDQIISRGTQIKYFIPNSIDREDQMISYNAHLVGKQTLPVFAKFLEDTKEFEFSPTQLDSLQDYQIQLDLTDSFGASSFSLFNITLYDSSSFIQQNQESNSNQSSNSSFGVKYQVNKQEEVQYQILGIEIIKVTRDQKATIKITNLNQNSPTSEIFAQISNSSLEIVMMQQNISFKIDFQILNKDLLSSLIQVNLKYPDPLNVSIRQQPEQIKVTTLRRVHIMKNQVQTILPEFISDQQSIPAQITTILEKSFTNVLQNGRIGFTKINVVNMLIGFIIQMIFIKLEDISFLAINSMIAISIPGIPSTIQSV